MGNTNRSIHADASVSNQRDALKEMLLERRREHVEALESLDAEISEIQTELRRRIDDAQSRRQPIEEALTHLDALLQIEGWKDSEEGDVHQSQTPSGDGKASIEAAYDLLSTLGNPLHYRELALRLTHDGVYLAGKDPAATLLSKMSRDDRFRRAPERGVYGLASWRMRKRSSRKRKVKRSRSSRTQNDTASRA